MCPTSRVKQGAVPPAPIGAVDTRLSRQRKSQMHCSAARVEGPRNTGGGGHHLGGHGVKYAQQPKIEDGRMLGKETVAP